MTRRRLAIFLVLAVALAFGACTLNPQPLPPFEDPKPTSGEDQGNGGNFSGSPSASERGDAAPDGGDAGDGGDSGPLDGGDAGDV